MQQYLLAIDQGTTNSRAILFSVSGELVAQHEAVLSQYYPQSGWVEQDPEEYYSNTLMCIREVVQKAGIKPTDIAAVGLCNQRETTIIWDKKTGRAIYPAIVWQDRRTAAACKALAPEQAWVQAKTGLLLDPYFSATKIAWILDHVPQARQQAEKGALVFGTVDTYLLWRLTNGKSHLTDMTNASRTLLCDIHTGQWDEKLLSLFSIPRTLLPTIVENTHAFGELDPAILGCAIPITGMAGDQQAATIGQACFQSGMVKSTYGTGCFMLLNTGTTCVISQHHLLSTIAYRINGQTIYGLEGSIFSAGSTIKWLRDTLRLIKTAAESEDMAKAVTDTDGVYLVPAFTGLGAPYWDPYARAAILGLTRNSGPAHIVRAGLESVAYQTRDLLTALKQETSDGLQTVRVDGGMVQNEWLLQFIADMADCTVEKPRCVETTALGVAFLAGLQVGIYGSLADIAGLWQLEKRYEPLMGEREREAKYAGWQGAVESVI